MNTKKGVFRMYEEHGFIYFDESHIYMMEEETKMLSLNTRLKVAKKFTEWAHKAKVDVMPSTLIAWMEMQGWIDTDKLEEDMSHE